MRGRCFSITAEGHGDTEQMLTGGSRAEDAEVKARTESSNEVHSSRGLRQTWGNKVACQTPGEEGCGELGVSRGWREWTTGDDE